MKEEPKAPLSIYRISADFIAGKLLSSRACFLFQSVVKLPINFYTFYQLFYAFIPYSKSYFPISELLIKAILLLSGDQDGVFIDPCPPYM